MPNENTARRGLYLPKELDDWFGDQSDETGIKINALIISALKEYKECHSKSARRRDDAFDKKVNKLIEKYLENIGYQKIL